MGKSSLTRLTEHVQRIAYGGTYVDLVSTSEGTVRIGSMPDIAKFLTEHKLHSEFVAVPEWRVSLAGDNRTGEEFVLWQAQVLGSKGQTYVGRKQNMKHTQHQLERIFPYFFDEKRLAIVRKNWLKNWFHPQIAEPQYRIGDLTVFCSPNTIALTDKGKIVYDQNELAPAENPDEAIETLLKAVPRDNTPRETLEVIPVGCGNGLHGTAANVIVKFDNYVVWIDPCGYPAHTLARHNIHWDDVTHVLFTHNHEDHVQGFTACLQRACKQNGTINILAAQSVFNILEELYTPLFPDMKKHVITYPLVPGSPLHLGPLTIESRWNHHILPYGTIGLRISAGGACFGYSGDTKYDVTINSILNREELTAEWFASCDLVFHEIDFGSPDSVHTHWEQVAALQQALSGTVLGYHTPFMQNSPFPLAQEGHCYVL